MVVRRVRAHAYVNASPINGASILAQALDCRVMSNRTRALTFARDGGNSRTLTGASAVMTWRSYFVDAFSWMPASPALPMMKLMNALHVTNMYLAS